MTENTELREDGAPKPTDLTSEEGTADTTPQDPPQDITVPVKYNKETRQLSLKEASLLAQKGMKFDAISDDLERLRRMASRQNNSISQFLCGLERQHRDTRMEELLEQSGGNRELAERMLELEENGNSEAEFELGNIKEYFPEIKQISDLPQEVVERARLRGSALLDEYLRYNQEKKLINSKAARAQESAAQASVGPLGMGAEGTDTTSAEFLKGLWGR